MQYSTMVYKNEHGLKEHDASIFHTSKGPVQRTERPEKEPNECDDIPIPG